jgi:DNA 3'-phosphatase
VRAALLLLLCATALADPTGEELLARRKIDPRFKYDGSGKIKVAFFDADSTLRVAPSGQVSANGPRDAWVLPGVTSEIERLNAEGYLVVIVSNQGGVPKKVSLADADGALDFVRKMVEWLNPNARIHYLDFAEKYDRDRKPDVGMFERVERMIAEKYEGATIDLKQSFMCGDAAGEPGDMSDSDRKVAKNYHDIEFKDPADFFHWRKHGVTRFKSKAEVDEYFAKNPHLRLPFPGKCPFPSLVPKPPAP